MQRATVGCAFIQDIRQCVNRTKTRATVMCLALGLTACGTSATATRVAAVHHGRPVRAPVVHGKPRAVEPTAGIQGPTATVQSQAYSQDPVGDPNAHAPSLAQVRRQLRLQLVAVHKTDANYINPLHYVTCCGTWERTDQGVDATMPVGAPILAPSAVKVLDIEPGWYAGQPLVYFELLAGPDAGKVQYVAEEITDIARPGQKLAQGQVIARYAASGTGIEYGWSTPSGITLAVATGGYEEGQITPAGRSIRAWLNALGANAGPSHH